MYSSQELFEYVKRRRAAQLILKCLKKNLRNTAFGVK